MPLAPEGRAVGVMLPTSNGAAVTVLALLSGGRVPAMINFTAGAANILGACRAAEVDTILTAHAFVEKARLEKLIAALDGKVRIVYLEDIRKTVSFSDKLRGALQAKKPLVKRKPDDWAVILFTSGTEGVPKGVVLSHRNVLANVAQAEARIDFGREDRLFMALPAFHSFGFMGGIVLPLISGVPTYFYPSPLHYRTVPELVYGICATYLFGTDTFLAGYGRMANPYDFRSLRCVIAGGEPVKDSTRQVWMEKFGLRILEGYGVTETSPVLAFNTPMFNKYGSVGRLFPGIEVRLEKVEGVDEGGRMFVKGPNVMLGYLRADHPGVLERPARRLARHRRYRRHRRAGIYRHQGTRQALRQSRRRDDLACRRGNAGGRAVAELRHRRCRHPRRPQGRAAGHGHRQEGRDALRFPRLCAFKTRLRVDAAVGDHHPRQIAAARLGQARSGGVAEIRARAGRSEGGGGGIS